MRQRFTTREVEDRPAVNFVVAPDLNKMIPANQLARLESMLIDNVVSIRTKYRKCLH